MFLRSTIRRKDGKEHRYWSIVENRRLRDGRVVQRAVLYLGEINSSQERAWRRSIEVLDETAPAEPQTIALFPEDRCEAAAADQAVVRLRLSRLELRRPRQWGACWLALKLWQELRLDRFFAARLPASRKGTRWEEILFVLVAYRLIAPGSEWFGKSALADLLGGDFGLAEAHKLYACHDLLLAHKQALFSHLVDRWRDLFNALVVTPEGLPLAYEVLAGNTADNTTLRVFLAKIEAQYGKARRVFVMDRGIPTEAVLAEMRQSDPPVQYLVGTPKGRLSRLERGLLDKPWREARPGVRVKLMAQAEEFYVLAHSADRTTKERGMRRRQLKWLWARLKQLKAMTLTREALLMKLGASRQKAPAAWRLIDVRLAEAGASFTYALNRDKLHQARRREGRYLLRTNLAEDDPADLWAYYLQLVAVEEAFKTIKGDLAIRPIFHQSIERIEAHIFVAFLAYCLYVTLARRLNPFAPGLTAPSIIEKFAAVQMIDLHVPTTDGRELRLTRYTEPEPELRLILDKLRLVLPAQQMPTIASNPVPQADPL